MPYKDKAVKNAKEREYYQTHKREGRHRPPEVTAKTYQNWKQNSPASYLLSKARTRARLRGLDFSITVADIPIPEFCPVFPWLKLVLPPKGEAAPTAPSIDRIDSTKGYIPGNVRVISWHANRLKSNMSPEEARYILADLERTNVQDHRD